MKWHDGEDFTADDVVFSYSIPLHEDYTGPRGLPFEIIEEVNKIDDYKVEFVLSEPYAPFITITRHNLKSCQNIYLVMFR